MARHKDLWRGVASCKTSARSFQDSDGRLQAPGFVILPSRAL